MPAGMTVLAQTAGLQRVGRVMSIVGVPMLLGPILGPVLGGWLVDDVDGRWIFYVNVPIGIVALPLAWRILERDVPRPHMKLDLLGFLLVSRPARCSSTASPRPPRTAASARLPRWCR